MSDGLVLLQLHEPGETPAPHEHEAGAAAGIDLGPTNSVVALSFDGETEVLRGADGRALIPSVVHYRDDGVVEVGAKAREAILETPDHVVSSIKRLMGRGIEDVKALAGTLPYTVEPNPEGGMVRLRVAGRVMTPVEISADILRAIKARAEEALSGRHVSRAVITVPAYFDDAARTATTDAARLADLEVLRLVNEPTAAALAYGLDNGVEGLYAVYDLGGGTFDISILELGEGVFEVKSTNGDTHLGGDDFDRRVMEWLVEEFRKDTGIDLSKDRMALQRLKEAAEKAKIELSNVQQAEINLPFITADASGPKHLQKSLSRAAFERMIDDLLQKSIEPCKKAIADAGITAAQIDEVILVGGSTRIPKVQTIVRDLFGKENFFLEIQDHGLEEDKVVMPQVYRMSRETGIPRGLPYLTGWVTHFEILADATV